MGSPLSDWSYREAFVRNRGLIPDGHQDILREAHIAIAGLGGVGGVYATTLARLGIGNFSIADSDVFELVNMNRQAGATTKTLGQEKAKIIENMILDINPSARVTRFPAITSDNVGAFLEGVDVLIDGIDFFSIEARRLLFKEARARRIPTITCAPIGFGASLLTFAPETMSFDTYFRIDDSMSRHEQLLSFALGLSPLLIHRSYFKPKSFDLHGEVAPSSVIATMACANLVTTQVYKILNSLEYDTAPLSAQFDPYVQQFQRFTLWGGNRNPLQLLKKWYFKRILNLKW
uniref:ThiF/MoeB/HesA family E1-like protein n=1 Tax=uncultured bacterium CSLC2 TaxID=1091571 RepID=Q8KP01_9BACT|nr:ThiF/MoeB/HesA family E1-like protein [uncultured bacterium CSLC2]